jgi:tetratricopeptide (TPR) repeat protein
MRRIGGYATIVLLAVPVAAQAQTKPSNSMHTRSAEIYIERANSAAATSERNELLAKALEVLAEGIESDAGNPKVWFMVGQAYARMGDAAGADSSFDKAVAIYPEYEPEIEPERLNVWITRYNQGITALQAGDMETAKAHFEAADRIYRGRAEAVVLLGSLREQGGDLPGAEEAYRTAIEITQGPAAGKLEPADRADWIAQEQTAAGRLATLLAQLGRNDEAIAVYESIVERHPENGALKADLAAQLAAAGRADEAAAIYEDLLANAELSDLAWFNAGVRLYSAEQAELAARAFRKSAELNPYSRDTWYNLGQALYALSNVIETDSAVAADPAAKASLAGINEELRQVAQRVQELDPANRQSLMMEAQAMRTLSEAASDAAARKERQDQVVAMLEEAGAMPFEVSGIQLRVQPESVLVTGRLTNLKLTAGQTVTLDFSLVGEGGEAIATHTVSVTAGEADATTPFEFTVPTGAVVLGWKYTIAS